MTAHNTRPQNRSGRSGSEKSHPVRVDMDTPNKKRRQSRIPPIQVSKDRFSQQEAFVECMHALGGRRELTMVEWLKCHGLYAGWRHLTEPAAWARLWYFVDRHRKGALRIGPKQLRIVIALVEFAAIRDARWRNYAKATGYWRSKEREKKERDPTKYKADAAQRQREYRARKREAAREALYAQLLEEALELDADIAAVLAELRSRPALAKDEPSASD